MKSAEAGPAKLRLRLRQATMHWGERLYISLYRLLGGRWVDRWTAGAPAILLTTTGRRSGLARTVALGHLRVGKRLVVAGTNGGLAPVPGWVWNLRADPRCRVEAGRDAFAAVAVFLEGEGYQDYWNRLVTRYPIYETARQMLERPIPLVALDPVEG